MTTTTDAPLRIIQLTAENIKRLKTIDITPHPTMQIVQGRNAQGKTSVLDAIWFALGGAAAQKGTAKPVREGEAGAHVRLDLGDFVVTRRWNSAGKSTLTVEAANGARFSSPQAILDALVGKLSFDPLAFTRLPAKEQRAALLDLVDLDVDVDALDRERAEVYAERTEIGRAHKRFGTVEVDANLPAEETSAADILASIRKAQDHNQQIAAQQNVISSLRDRCKNIDVEIKGLQERLMVLRRRRKESKDEIEAQESELDKLGEPQDVEPLESRLDTIEDENARIRENNAARERAAKQERLRQQYDERTAHIEAIDKQKREALAAAKFPVDGLGFDEQGVTYRGVPFSQASAAEQIRVSLAMAMSLNPRLRVIRILDGSLLDDDNLATIREMAAAGGYQVWVERVGDGDEAAVVIEDGEVQS